MIANVIRTTEPISASDIVNFLLQLRKRAYPPFSNFYVAAVLEIKQENYFYYIGGVNVENHDHNRLSIHAEQNAIAIASTLLGKFKLQKVWVMGAPGDDVIAMDQSYLNQQVQLCGHCRQILMGFANKDTLIISVSMNGNFSAPKPLTALLPEAFLQEDLYLESNTTLKCTQPSVILEHINSNEKLNLAQIISAFKNLNPLIIHPQNQTSAISKCILQFKSNRYVPGVLVQDVAFLTTDAIFCAYGFAVSLYGINNLSLEAIHVAYDDLEASDNNTEDMISSSELSLLATISETDFSIYFYKNNEFQSSSS